MEAVFELIDLIYDSVADPSRWQVFLDAFVRAVRAKGGTMAITPPDAFVVACWSGWSPQAIEQYMDLYAADDPWRTYAVPQPEGAIVADFEYCPRGVAESSVAFREFYAPQDYIHGMGTIIVGNQSAISVGRGAKSGPFGESEKAILRQLFPHLRRAALLHGELGSTRTQLNTFTGHLDRYPHAFLLTSADGRVLFANRTAKELAQLKDGIAIEAGRLSLQSTKQNAALLEAMRKISSERDGSLQRVEVSRPSRKTPYRLVLMPVGTSNFIPLGVAMPAVSLLIIDSDSRQELDTEVLRELFSLTPAEAGIAAKLALGLNLDEIAAATGITRETVRTHVKRILSKTATERQSELVSLILRSAPFRHR